MLANFCWRSFAGEALPAKFLSETCRVYILVKFAAKNRHYVFAFSSLNKSTKIPTNFTMHHARNQKKIHQAANIYPPHIFIKICVAQFGLPICGASVLMQRLSERLTSPIPGLGGFSQGS